ncbi:MAG: chromate resistance protein ChrB domain-containing protein, partial [Kofleriaceae bacterium]
MTPGTSWLLLIHQLPTRPAYLRVKVWRRVLRLGAIALRGSVYILPNNDQALEDFQWLGREISTSGGEASVCEARFIEGTSNADVEALFRAARDADYAMLADEIKQARRRKQALAADDVTRFRRRLDEIVAIDFFGASRRETVELVVASLEAPRARGPHISTRAHHGRTWVTRAGIKIDRMACAWLIRRFIDPAAKLVFVDVATYVPTPAELRFDMSDAEFTHEGDDCSFETLVRRFDLRDPALQAIAEIVHDIDLKDDRFQRAEALGLAHVISGIASASRDDEQRLTRSAAVLDD